MRDIEVLVTYWQEMPDDVLLVRGYVNGQPTTAFGHATWLEKYWDEDSPIDKANPKNYVGRDIKGELSGEIREKRAMTQEEARTYAERLLLEARGLWGLTEARVQIQLDEPPPPEPEE